MASTISPSLQQNIDRKLQINNVSKCKKCKLIIGSILHIVTWIEIGTHTLSSYFYIQVQIQLILAIILPFT